MGPHLPAHSVTPLPTEETPALRRGIVRAVAYADVFDHPLTAREIHRYLVGVEAERPEVEGTLAHLVPDPLAERDGFYFLHGRDSLVESRRRRAAEASRQWPGAREWARRIAALPFVRMVALTGSLARDGTDPEGDLDFLVVAEDGRLWICRALVGLLTRRARADGVVLCANYFLSDEALALDERDIYTAHEIVQMVPLAGEAWYRRLREANRWVRFHLPNAEGPPTDEPVATVDRRPGRRLFEAILRSPPGRWLDELERRRKRRTAVRRARDLSEARFEPRSFKGHFEGHGRRALAGYHERLRRLGKGGP